MIARILTLSAFLILIGHPAFAAVVDFGLPEESPQNWNALSRSTETDGSITFTRIQDGITFQLNIRGVAGTAGTLKERDIKLFENGAGLGVVGNEMDTRISKGSSGIADDEYILVTISTSGASLSTLSLGNINFRYTDAKQGTDILNFIDHEDNEVAIAGTSDVDYAQLKGLKALTSNNCSRWSLAIGSIESTPDLRKATDGILAVGQISFEYTKGQNPKSLGLLID